ncbi:hypothetical protein BDV97DRAFT_294234 [Delphinella strobiligena]|nr:hypothetical protein BDV97DRAFT_294234 [Delphinella strobiligena]
MRASTFLLAVFRFLLPPAILATLLLYLYPAVQSCAFPAPTLHNATSPLCYPNNTLPVPANLSCPIQPPAIAPFRLLALGDPQLEGDSSLPSPNAKAFPSLHKLPHRLNSAPLAQKWPILKSTFETVFRKDIPKLLKGYRKRLDLLGNDFYLAHIYRLVSWYTVPTHTTVLGDLLGSQWISDAEFDRRADRFWHRVFRGIDKVDDEIMDPLSAYNIGDVGSEEYRAWEKRLINVAGNHDIGYAGDIDERRIERFERRFGRVNWNLKFTLSLANYSSHQTPGRGGGAEETANQPPPELELVILNDMNLDRPAWDETLRAKSWAFLDEVMERVSKRKNHATVLLTHIPLFKEEGVCADPPFFNHFPNNHGGGIKEQNHLSWLTSRMLLDGLFGHDNRRGIVLDGHDHEGCDIYHNRPLEPSEREEQEGWRASKYKSARQRRADDQRHGVREITVRSMMGSYWGNAGLLSGWFDEQDGEWRFEYDTCILGVQHIWWAVHVLDFVVVLFGLASVAALGADRLRREPVVVVKTTRRRKTVTFTLEVPTPRDFMVSNPEKERATRGRARAYTTAVPPSSMVIKERRHSF